MQSTMMSHTVLKSDDWNKGSPLRCYMIRTCHWVLIVSSTEWTLLYKQSVF